MEQELMTEEIMRQLKAIALADVSQVVQVIDGQPVVADFSKLPEDARLAVCSVEKNTSGVQVKFYDKLKALELLGRAVGLFEQKLTVKSSGNDLLQAVLRSTKEVMDVRDLPELQQAATAGIDLVEQGEIP